MEATWEGSFGISPFSTVRRAPSRGSPAWDTVSARPDETPGFRRVLYGAIPAEKRLESENVSLVAHVGQIRHHVRHHFESAVLALLERVADGGDGVAAVGVAGNVLELAADEEKTS